MFLTIPIIKTAGFGGIPEETIDRLIARLNEK